MGYVFETVNNTYDNNEIGLGVKFSNTNVISTLYDVNDQEKENLKLLLLTGIGERYMLPEFGTDLLKILFEPNTPELKDTVRDIIVNSTSYWLPYIVIDEVEVITNDDPASEHVIEISIMFRINSSSNLDANSLKILLNSKNQIFVI